MISRFFRNSLQIPWLPLWLGPTLLLGPNLLSGKVLFWGVPYLQFVPWRYTAWQNLLAGQLPLWNSTVGMGAPLLANYQSALIYPPNWFLLLAQALGGTTGQAWMQWFVIWLHLVWAGIGMALLARQIGLGKTAQAVSGIAFGLSSYLVSRSSFLSINAAVSWLPWVILATERIKPWGRTDGFFALISRSVPLGVFFGLQLLSGHAQLTWYSLLFASIWLVAVNAIRNRLNGITGRIFPFIIGILLGVMLASIQLIPTAEYLVQSQRASEVGLQNALNYSFWPWKLLTLISPWFFGSPATGDYWFNVFYWEDAVYVGLLPLIVGIISGIGLILKRAKNNDSTLRLRDISIGLFVIIPISILLALGRYTPIFPFLYTHVPTFNMFQGPTRWSLWAVFGLALLGGVGVERWRRPTKKGLYWSRLATAGSIAITLGAVIAWLTFGDVTPTFIKALVVAGILGVGIGLLNLSAPGDTESKFIKFWPGLIIILLVIDLVSANWGILPAYPAELYRIQPSSVQKVRDSSSGGRLWSSTDTQYSLLYIRTLSTQSYTPGVDWKTYQQYLLTNANSLYGISSANNYDPLIPARYSFWMDQLNKADPRLQNAMLEMMDVGSVEKLDYQESIGVRFESLPHPGRFTWSPCAQFASNRQDAWGKFLKMIGKKDQGIKINSVVILEGNGDSSSTPCTNEGEASIRTEVDSPQYIKLSTRASQAGWIVESDVWYPGWSVKIDGNPTSLLVANTLFRGFRVPEGQHTIEIVYRPISFMIGLLISLIGVIGIGCVLFLQRNQKLSLEFGKHEEKVNIERI